MYYATNAASECTNRKAGKCDVGVVCFERESEQEIINEVVRSVSTSRRGKITCALCVMRVANETLSVDNRI